MTFRTRLTVLTCAAIAVTLVATSLATYWLARQEAYGQVDAALKTRIDVVRAFHAMDAGHPGGPAAGGTPAGAVTAGRHDRPRIPGIAPGAAGGFSRALDTTGKEVPPARRQPPAEAGGASRQPDPGMDESKLPQRVRRELRSSRVRLPISPAARRLARGDGQQLLLETLEVDGSRYRVVSGRVGDYTVQVARPITETTEFLDRLLLLLSGVTVIGIAGGVAAALVVTRAASAPVHRLTQLTEAVRESGDLSKRVQATGNDELARLAVSFNAMLEELERSVERQQHLVDDASHQLRTPLASIRTNMDVLLRARQLDEEVTRDIMGDLSAQVDELTSLVRDLVDLASSVESSLEREPVRLDEVAEEAVRRVRGAFPDLHFETHLEPTIVSGSEERLVRMAQNLLHNAGKWSPHDGTVEVRVGSMELRIVDHGSGVADPEKQRIFERFHRAADARGVPGSGLGLAIVQQVVLDHDATVDVTDTPGGGATFVVRFPALEP